MKRNILSGLIILLPLAITVAVFIFLVDLLTTPFLGNVESLLQFIATTFDYDLGSHKALMIVISRIVILILLFIVVMILGFLGNKIIFHWLVKTMHTIMGKIPLINSIYKMCKDIIEAMFSENKKLFSRVVVVPFPSKESNAVGLVTGNAPCGVQHADVSQNPQEVLKTVFVPTSPHPISGFLLMIEEKRLSQMDISVEDAFKFLISCGIFKPCPVKGEHGDRPDDNDTQDKKDHILPDKE